VGTFDSAAPDPVATSEVLVVAHALRVFRVVANQLFQLLFGLLRGRSEALEADDDLFDLASTQVFGDSMDPPISQLGFSTVLQTGKLPSVFDGMPEVEDLAASYEHPGAIPDPLGTIADDNHNGPVAEPAQLLELRPEALEDDVGRPEAGNQCPSQNGPAPRRWRCSLGGHEKHAGLDLSKVAIFHRRQRLQHLVGRFPVTALLADLHAQSTAVDAQDDRIHSVRPWRGLSVGVAVVLTQGVGVALSRLPEPLNSPPDRHCIHLDTEEDERQASSKLVGYDHTEQGE